MTRASGRTQTCGPADARTRLAQGGSAAASGLRRLLDLKDTAHYGLIPVSRQRLTVALRQARSLVDFGANVSRR